MPNIHFAMLASPDKHEEFVKEINKWKYPIEGKVAKGTQSPYVSELKFYEVRVPPEIEGEFVRDMDLVFKQDMFGKVKNFWLSAAFLVYRVALWFSPYKPLPRVNFAEKKRFKLGPGWAYILPIGKLDRKKVEVRNGEPREVL